MNIIQKKFREAREFLGISQNAASKEIGLTSTAINQFESGKSTRANFDYAIYLIENGINPYFLIGKSEEIEGQKVTGFVSEEEYEKLKEELEELQDKYETLRDILEVDVDEDGNVKKRK